MPRTRSLAWSELKIGIVSVVALALAMFMIFLLGSTGGFAWQRYSLKVMFDALANSRRVYTLRYQSGSQNLDPERTVTLTVTLPEMTRFLLSLDRAVDTVFAAIRDGFRGETFVPKVLAAPPSAVLVDSLTASSQ